MKDKIIDYISGLYINAKQEEILAIQPFSKILVEDFHYPKYEIQTHPQIYVKSCPSDLKGYPIDIAVYENRGTKNEKLKMIIECKNPTRNDGRKQLEIYLKFCEAQIGVWYNGNESLYIKKVKQLGNITFEEIPTMPNYKEKLEEIGLYKRKELIKTHNLKDIFLNIRNYLVGNAIGATRDEFIAKQIIILILCKIYDEKFTEPNNNIVFRTTISDTNEDIINRINNLFYIIKEKYKDIFDSTDSIDLDAKSLKYIVGKLQKFCIIECDRDVISDAFGIFIGYSLKGEQGQFFTPQNIIHLLVQIVNPKKNDLIIDPACGSGGFLIESLKHIWKQIDKDAIKFNWTNDIIADEKKEISIKYIRGIDKDSFLTKITKAYMVILGNNEQGIFCQNSLDDPTNWDAVTQQFIKLNSFDIVLTNPPFGKNIKIVEQNKLNQYYLAYKIDSIGNKTLIKECNVTTLFIERSLQLLKNGGKLGIVLPETYFHAPKHKHILEYILKNNNITHIIDLPINTFKPYTGAKCIILVLEKGIKQQENILMAVAEQIGHDHQGKTIYKIDENGNKTNIIYDDTTNIINEIKNNKCDKYTFQIPFIDILKNKILVPRYYWNNNKTKDNKKINNFDLISMQQLIDEKIIVCFDGNGSPKAQFKGTGNIPYIRVKDIVNWQVYTDMTALISEQEYKRLYKKEKELLPKDILYVRRGSTRIGSVAMMSPYNLKCILTREILVIRVINLNNKYGITPEYLMYALSHKIVFEESQNKIFIDTTLPNIAERWKWIKIPIFKDMKQFNEIKSIMNNIVYNQWQAQKYIKKCKEDFDIYNV